MADIINHFSRMLAIKKGSSSACAPGLQADNITEEMRDFMAELGNHIGEEIEIEYSISRGNETVYKTEKGLLSHKPSQSSSFFYIGNPLSFRIVYLNRKDDTPFNTSHKILLSVKDRNGKELYRMRK